jgi:large subunit ribosomal protein L26e
MSCSLSKALREKYGVRSLPIKRGDEISFPNKRVKGAKRERTQAKVTTVYRKKWCIFVDKHTKEKQNGQTVNIPLTPSVCRIEKLYLNKDRKEYIDRKTRLAEKAKNKNTGN